MPSNFAKAIFIITHGKIKKKKMIRLANVTNAEIPIIEKQCLNFRFLNMSNAIYITPIKKKLQIIP